MSQLSKRVGKSKILMSPLRMKRGNYWVEINIVFSPKKCRSFLWYGTDLDQYVPTMLRSEKFYSRIPRED